MTQLTYTVPTVGNPNSTEDPKIVTALTQIETVVNGNLDSGNITAATAQSAQVNQPAQTVKGSSVIATSQSVTSTSYTTLTNPDQVAGITLASPGLLAVWFQATWQESVANKARAALFLNSNQLTIMRPIQGSPTTQAALTNATIANTNRALSTAGFGLYSDGNGSNSGDVTTGQVVGIWSDAGFNTAVELGGSIIPLNASSANVGMAPSGPCYIFAAPGTYTVSVQFKSASGSVTVSNRRLYVAALSFT